MHNSRSATSISSILGGPGPNGPGSGTDGKRPRSRLADCRQRTIDLDADYHRTPTKSTCNSAVPHSMTPLPITSKIGSPRNLPNPHPPTANESASPTQNSTSCCGPTESPLSAQKPASSPRAHSPSVAPLAKRESTPLFQELEETIVIEVSTDAPDEIHNGVCQPPPTCPHPHAAPSDVSHLQLAPEDGTARDATTNPESPSTRRQPQLLVDPPNGELEGTGKQTRHAVESSTQSPTSLQDQRVSSVVKRALQPSISLNAGCEQSAEAKSKAAPPTSSLESLEARSKGSPEPSQPQQPAAHSRDSRGGYMRPATTSSVEATPERGCLLLSQHRLTRLPRASSTQQASGQPPPDARAAGPEGTGRGISVSSCSGGLGAGFSTSLSGGSTFTRMRRMPTRECRSVSICDSDGYLHLNQYLLKQDIGKVCSSETNRTT